MIRFILAIMILVVLLKVTQDNPYVGFGIWMVLAVSFLVYTVNMIDCDDVEYEQHMLKTKEGRRKYYYLINAQ
jgi:hypothetical protein